MVFESCYNTTNITCNSLNCDATRSCASVDIINNAPSTSLGYGCQGFRSCESSTMTTNFGLWCEGTFSCLHTMIDYNVRNDSLAGSYDTLWCGAKYGCIQSTINVEGVFVDSHGLYALQDSIVNMYGNSTLRARGYFSAYNTTVTCMYVVDTYSNRSKPVNLFCLLIV